MRHRWRRHHCHLRICKFFRKVGQDIKKVAKKASPTASPDHDLMQSTDRDTQHGYETSQELMDEHGDVVYRDEAPALKRFVFVRWNIINIEDIDMKDGSWVRGEKKQEKKEEKSASAVSGTTQQPRVL